MIENLVRESGFIYNPNKVFTHSVRVEDKEKPLDDGLVRKPSNSDVFKDKKHNNTSEIRRSLRGEENVKEEEVNEKERVHHVALNPDCTLKRLATEEINRLTHAKHQSVKSEITEEEENRA